MFQSTPPTINTHTYTCSCVSKYSHVRTLAFSQTVSLVVIEESLQLECPSIPVTVRSQVYACGEPLHCGENVFFMKLKGFRTSYCTPGVPTRAQFIILEGGSLDSVQYSFIITRYIRELIHEPLENNKSFAKRLKY